MIVLDEVGNFSKYQYLKKSRNNHLHFSLHHSQLLVYHLYLNSFLFLDDQYYHLKSKEEEFWGKNKKRNFF